MADIELKTEDTLPYLDYTLVKDDEGTPYDLTGATVVFSMGIGPGNASKIDRGSVTIMDATSGEVRYEFSASDTNIVGDYYGEFEAELSTGKVVSFPYNGYLRIKIREDMG